MNDLAICLVIAAAFTAGAIVCYAFVGAADDFLDEWETTMAGGVEISRPRTSRLTPGLLVALLSCIATVGFFLAGLIVGHLQ